MALPELSFSEILADRLEDLEYERRKKSAEARAELGESQGKFCNRVVFDKKLIDLAYSRAGQVSPLDAMQVDKMTNSVRVSLGEESDCFLPPENSATKAFNACNLNCQSFTLSERKKICENTCRQWQREVFKALKILSYAREHCTAMTRALNKLQDNSQPVRTPGERPNPATR